MPASETSVMPSSPELEARLLHFYTSPYSVTGLWHLAHPNRRGMPIAPDATRANEPFNECKTYRLGFLETLTDVVGAGGLMDGWKVRSIGQGYTDSMGKENAIVIVVREKMEVEVEVERDVKGEVVEREVKKEEMDEWISTPEDLYSSDVWQDIKSSGHSLETPNMNDDDITTVIVGAGIRAPMRVPTMYMPCSARNSKPTQT
ncbi:MAG: hypothetical protein LQ341_001036 [Variospora aurantia]|nr:MAG: hypothetical protein LQ341_001036 [Variospora aurantia]